MAINVMDTVFKKSKMKGNAKLLMLVIANNANEDGGDSWPFQETMREGTGGLNLSTISRLVKQCVEAQELEVERPDRRRGNRYTVLLPGLKIYEDRLKSGHCKLQSQTLQDATSDVANQEVGHGDLQSPYIDEPFNEPSYETSSNQRVQTRGEVSPGESFDDLFEKIWSCFWTEYRRKVGKKAARTALERRLKREKKIERIRVLGRVIVKALRAQNAGQFKDRPIDKIPYPATWINGEHWEDEIETPPSTSPVAVHPADRRAAELLGEAGIDDHGIAA